MANILYLPCSRHCAKYILSFVLPNDSLRQMLILAHYADEKNEKHRQVLKTNFLTLEAPL